MLRRFWLWLVGLFSSGKLSPKSPVSIQTRQGAPAKQRRPLYQARAFDAEAVMELAAADVTPTEPGRKTPTAMQLQLIHSQAGAQAIVAGAGSGKSTSLVTRLLFMNKHLGIPLQHLSVFTFTRNSRFDFIDKLVKEALRWGVKLEEKAATQRVRTFHSKVLELSRSSLPAGTQIFDMMGKKAKPKPGSEEEQVFLEEQEALADELESPFDSNRGSEQSQLLRHVYRETYTSSAAFREDIGTLLRFAFRSRPKTMKHADGDWEKRRLSAARDAVQTAHALEFWTARGRWPASGLITAPPRALSVEGLTFRAHGYVPSVDAFVVLGCPFTERTPIEADGTRFNPYYSGCSKHIVLLRGCSDTVLFLNQDADFDALDQLLGAVADERDGKPPLFKIQLPGEITESDIFEALYDVGGFAENLALQPADLADRLSSSPLGPIERATTAAVSEFYANFRTFCSANGIRTFNELFLAFNAGSAKLSDIPLASLRSMKHLLIDEFQDISPLIVKFVQGLHEELHRRSGGDEHPTLLAVGDDWQSIYGWRGSAPHFFLRFPDLFDGAAKKPVLLTDNFRSSQKIVDAAAFPIQATSGQHRMDKQCTARNPKVASAPHPVWVIEDDIRDDLSDIVGTLMAKLKDDESVLILARTRTWESEAKKKTARWKSDKRLRCMTIHKSKGLEATYVVILGDTYYANSSPLRNAMYRAAGFEQSYDEAQFDEAKRLAYVAVTRAERLCVWTGVPRDAGSMETLSSASNSSYRRGDLGQLKRALQEI